MRIGIRLKVLLPVLLALATVFAVLIVRALNAGRAAADAELARVFEEKRVGVEDGITQAAADALEQAGLFSRLPDVVEVYRAAGAGRLDDPKDPIVHAQRLRLRELTAGYLAGYNAVGGKGGFQLHYHLPNSRSFLRVWRKTQSLDGRDESDDISSFRPTVVDVNRSPHRAVSGIEVGRGGFAIRGVAPVTGPNGEHLGSVEMLQSLDRVTAHLKSRPQQDFAVFMKRDLLGVARQLGHKPEEHPVTGEFVLVGATNLERVAAHVRAEVLAAGLQGPTAVGRDGAFAVQAWPIRDYRGEPVGVMAFIDDRTASDAALAAASEDTLTFGVLALVGVLGLMFLVTQGVVGPLRKLMDVARAVTRDGGAAGHDVPARLLRQRDEVGVLARDVAQMLASMQAAATATQTDRDLLARSVDEILEATERFARGDLAVRLREDESGSALDQLRVGFNLALSNLGLLVRELASDAGALAASAEELKGIAGDLHQRTRSSATRAADAGRTATMVNGHMQRMAAATHELDASIQEIATNTRNATKVSQTATRNAAAASDKVADLERASKAIAKVVRTISDISMQTHLLALNAAVEAARAGDSGKGFAVVASEVRELAGGTSTAVESIIGQIQGIQADIAEAVTGIAGIQGVIHEIDRIDAEIATAVAQQSTATSDIGHAVGEAANGSALFVDHVEQVAHDVEVTTGHAAATAAAADELARMAARIQGRVAAFRLPDAPRAAKPEAGRHEGARPKAGSGAPRQRGPGDERWGAGLSPRAGM